jgi:hypothetical protein
MAGRGAPCDAHRRCRIARGRTTVNPNGYSEGSIDQKQLAWLTAELKTNSSRYLDSSGNWAAGGGADKVIAIFSHHTVETMNNTIGLAGSTARRSRTCCSSRTWRCG